MLLKVGFVILLTLVTDYSIQLGSKKAHERISLFIISIQTTERMVVKRETGSSRIKMPFMHTSDKQRLQRKGE